MLDVHVHNVAPTPYAWGVFNQVMVALEVPQGTIDLFGNPKIDAAAHATFIDGRRTIVYNPDSFSRLEIASRHGWGCYKVMAHEVGHHMWQQKQPDGEWGKNEWERELAADYYAGVALARLGSGSDDLHDYFGWAFYKEGNETHPDTVLRLRAIRRGWLDGGGRGQIETNLDILYEQYWQRMTRWWPDDHPDHPKFQRS